MNKPIRHFGFRTVAAAIAACLIIMGTATTAYAADIGGIQRIIQVWIHGDQTTATIEFDGQGNYSMDFTGEDGTTHSRGGGGVSIAPDGTPVPLTEEELMEHLTMPEVDYKDDGSVWVYWFGQSLEITDKFEDGVCYVKLVSGEKTLYMTIKYDNGYACSPNKYITPAEFN